MAMLSDLHPVQVDIYRRMSVEKKLEVMHSLLGTAWQLRAAGERRLHPDWSEDRVKRAVRDSFLYARD